MSDEGWEVDAAPTRSRRRRQTETGGVSGGKGVHGRGGETLWCREKECGRWEGGQT